MPAQQPTQPTISVGSRIMFAMAGNSQRQHGTVTSIVGTGNSAQVTLTVTNSNGPSNITLVRSAMTVVFKFPA